MLAISDTGDTGAPEPRWPTSSDRRPPYRDAAPPLVCTFPFCFARRRLSALDTAFFLARGNLCATRRRIHLFVHSDCADLLWTLPTLFHFQPLRSLLLARSLHRVAAAQSPSDCKSNGFGDRYSRSSSSLRRPLTRPHEWVGARAGLPASNDPEFGAWLPIVFDILQAIGLVGNVVLILTFLLAKDVRRHVTWLGFCCAWVFSSTAYLILSV
jgi:hypothetical protein